MGITHMLVMCGHLEFLLGNCTHLSQCGLENCEVNSRTPLNAFRSFYLFFFIKMSKLIVITCFRLSSPVESLSIAAFIAREDLF